MKKHLFLLFTRQSQYLLLILFIYMGLNLTACGFHLRGQTALPPLLRVLYLKNEAPFSSFITQLKQVLISSHLRIVDSPDQAPISLHIISTIFSHNEPIAGSNEARVYAFNYIVVFALEDNKGQNLAPPETVNIARTLILNPGQVLSNNNQSIQLQQQMEQDAIGQIFNRLNSRHTFDILQKYENKL
jgi:LPS-assembly lipoprotein